MLSPARSKSRFIPRNKHQLARQIRISYKNTSPAFFNRLSRISKSKSFCLFPSFLDYLHVAFRIQIKNFVIGLFAYNDDFTKFKTHLRDFLISLKEFSGDNAELYAEEREQALQDAKAAERDRAMKVGGLLKPADMDQDDDL